MRARPPQSATSRHYAEPIQANSGDYDELDGDYDLAGRDSTDRDEGYVHRVRPRRASDMSISVQGTRMSMSVHSRASTPAFPALSGTRTR